MPEAHGEPCRGDEPKRRRVVPLWKHLDDAAQTLARELHPDDVKALLEIRSFKASEDSEDLEGLSGLIQEMNARHGQGFWQSGMSDEEFATRLIARGREYALAMVGTPWGLHIYQRRKLQVAYIDEYFRDRAEVVCAELDALASEQVSGDSSSWKRFFSQLRRHLCLKFRV